MLEYHGYRVLVVIFHIVSNLTTHVLTLTAHIIILHGLTLHTIEDLVVVRPHHSYFKKN